MGLYRSLCQRKASAWIRLASLALSAFLLSQLIFSPGAWAAESSYSDTRGEECEDAVALLSEKGVINGYEDGTFRPNNTITRAEVTTIVNRMLGRAADKDYVDSHKDQLRQFPDVAQTNWAYYNIVEATNAHDYEKSGGTEDWTGLAD